MKKSEIFDIILDEISDVCEVRKDYIINGSKLQTVVDARILAVQYLKRAGLSDDDISLIVLKRVNDNPEYLPSLQDLKRKAKTVNKLFSMYTQRCLDSYAFCLMSVEIRNFCREKYTELHSPGMKELPM